jgi:cytosine/adenosine deaminase-related metal-dependent hydrolase
MSADFVREGTQLAVAEMLRAGITSFADMYLFPEGAARVASAARMRAAIGLPVADAPNVWADSATAHFERAEQLWDEYRADPWVCLYFAPQDPAFVSDETLIRVRRVADELDARVAMEAPPLRRLHSLGLLRPGFAAIPHTSWDDDEASLVATTGICVIRCLQGDLRLGALGAADILALRQRGPLLKAAPHHWPLLPGWDPAILRASERWICWLRHALRRSSAAGLCRQLMGYVWPRSAVPRLLVLPLTPARLNLGNTRISSA